MKNVELRIENEEVDAQTSFLNSQFSILNLAAAILLLIGYFLPWAVHPTSALTRSAHELAVMTNFTPGAGIFLNEWFLLPLWSAALLIALGALPYAPVTRSLAAVVALVVASLGFPTYPQILTAIGNPDYRLQFVVTLGIMAAIVGLLIASQRATPVRNYLVLACGLASAVPVVGYLAIKPFIEALYRGPVGLGLGWWLTLVAAVMMFMAASVKMLRSLALKRSGL